MTIQHTTSESFINKTWVYKLEYKASFFLTQTGFKMELRNVEDEEKQSAFFNH